MTGAIADGNSDINHAIDTVAANVTNSILTENHYVTETVMAGAIHDSLTNALNDYEIQNCNDVNDCVATAIANGNSEINHAIDTVVLNNVTTAIANGNSDINHAIDTVVLNNVTGAIANGNSDINHAIDTVVLNNMGNAIADGNSDINHAVDTVVLNNMGNAIADGNSDINHAIDTVAANVTNSILAENHYVTETVMANAVHDSIVYNIENIVSAQIHDSLTNALNDYEIQNCNDVNKCVFNSIADGNSDINHAIDTVAANVTNSVLAENHYVTETVMAGAIHDSIADFSEDLAELANRVNTFNTHVCDSVKDCVTGWIHDSLANKISAADICSTIETSCPNIAQVDANNAFTGINTVPSGFDIHTTDGTNCNNVVVNACDLFAVFDSLNRKFNAVYDSLARLTRELEELRNSIPFIANAPTMSNVTSTSMTATAHATAHGTDIVSYEFCISTNNDMSGSECHTVLATDADYYTFTGLDPNTDYYVQYSAASSNSTTPSPVVMQHTPAHAPTADVASPVSIKPAGFKVEVTNIDPKEKTDATTVQVCYKQSSTCPDQPDYDDYTCAAAQPVATGVTTNTQEITGLTGSTNYCVIVKVSNGDSTNTYGPYNVTTGEDVTLAVTREPSSATVYICETSTTSVTFTATPSDGDEYTYSWSVGSSATNTNTVALGSGDHNVYVTATHTTEGYTVTGMASVSVSDGGTPVTFGWCENDGAVSIKPTINGDPNYIDWGDGTTPYSGTVNESTEPHQYATSGTYTITVANESCSKSMTLSINVPDGTMASRTVKPCTSTSMGTHAVQTTGPNGLETANGSGQVTSVQDIDGNVYPVVEIGSQCWMAVNLRTTHKKNGNALELATPPTGSQIHDYYYNYSTSTIPFEQRGYLYNWDATMGGIGVSEGAQGICPTGWHVPTKVEWETMIYAAGASSTTGAAYLSGGCDWNTYPYPTGEMTPSCYTNPNRNDSGFSAVPAGFFNGTEISTSGIRATFWTSTLKLGDTDPWYVRIDSFDASVDVYYNDGYPACSVRCLRDQ